MNHKFFAPFILIAVLIAPFLCANAGYQTGQKLLIDCTGAYDDPVKTTMGPVHCIGYIDGIIDAHGLLSSALPEAKHFCAPPEGLSAGDAMDAVVLFIQKVPEARSMSGRVVVIKALQAKYPCR